MSNIVKMPAEARTGVGKGAARAIRRSGMVPAVIYGGKKPPLTIQIPGNELLKILQAGGFYTTTFEIDAGGEKNRVIPKDIQKNLLNGLPEHVDFFRLAKGAKIIVNVPVEFINEETSVGLKKGGVLNIVRHDVELEVDADNIPDKIEIDVASYDLGDGVHISAVTLPEGATPTITDRDFTIATIAAPSGLKSETNAEGEEDEAEGTADAEDKSEE